MVTESSNTSIRSIREALVHWFSVNEETYVLAPYWVVVIVIQSAPQKAQVQLCGQWDYNASVTIPASPKSMTR
jgi:hypothetical protein